MSNNNICHYCGEYKDVIQIEKLKCGIYDYKGKLIKKLFYKHRYKKDPSQTKKRRIEIMNIYDSI